jgi:hypothetical protein
VQGLTIGKVVRWATRPDAHAVEPPREGVNL